MYTHTYVGPQPRDRRRQAAMAPARRAPSAARGDGWGRVIIILILINNIIITIMMFINNIIVIIIIGSRSSSNSSSSSKDICSTISTCSYCHCHHYYHYCHYPAQRAPARRGDSCDNDNYKTIL